jgi:hypothetical protein
VTKIEGKAGGRPALLEVPSGGGHWAEEFQEEAQGRCAVASDQRPVISDQ